MLKQDCFFLQSNGLPCVLLNESKKSAETYLVQVYN